MSSIIWPTLFCSTAHRIPSSYDDTTSRWTFLVPRSTKRKRDPSVEIEKRRKRSRSCLHEMTLCLVFLSACTNSLERYSEICSVCFTKKCPRTQCLSSGFSGDWYGALHQRGSTYFIHTSVAEICRNAREQKFFLINVGRCFWDFSRTIDSEYSCCDKYDNLVVWNSWPGFSSSWWNPLFLTFLKSYVNWNDSE